VFRHVVLLRWKEGVTQDQKDAFEGALAQLPSKIDVLRAYHVGPDAGLAEGNHEFAIVAEFETAEDYPAYRDHPAHEAFKEQHLFPLVAERAAVQFGS
jgi:Stress responsive A/B Barrel Domain